MAVHKNLRTHWRDLKRGHPGRRFQERYERAQREDRRGHAGQRIALFAASGVCLVIGAVLAVIPGPAVPFFFLAGGLLATESRTIARFMDWSEVRIRRLMTWGGKIWRRLPRGGRVAVVMLAACASAGAAYLSFRLVRG